MGFNFPASPSIGATYSPGAGLPVYQWDGEKWKATQTAVGDGYVHYDIAQALTGAQQTQAKTNIAALGAESAVRYDAAQSLTATQKAQARANIDALKKNFIVNGGMMVSQENGLSVSSIAASSSYFSADQWLSYWEYSAGNASTANVATVTPSGSPNRLRFYNNNNNNAPAASNITMWQQRMEGLRVADLMQGKAGAKAFTVSFGVNGPAGTYSLCVANVASGASRRAYVTTFTIAAGEVSQDVYKTFTIPGDTVASGWVYDNTLGLMVSVVLAVGSTYQTSTLNAWQTNANAIGWSGQTNWGSLTGATIDLFDVGLYEGSVAPSFQVPDFGSELALCQRYYEKSYNYSVAPGTASSPGNYSIYLGTNSLPPNFDYGPLRFRTPKRATPTVTIYSIAGTAGQVSNGTVAADLGANSGNPVSIGENGAVVRQGNGATLTTTNLEVLFHYIATSRM